MGSLHDVRFPGESDEYRSARDELLGAEIDLRRADRSGRRPAQGAAARRRGRDDYDFDEWDADAGGPRRCGCRSCSSDGKDTLYLYSFMFVRAESQGLGFVGPCPSCTSIIDGIDGELPHITQRISFAVAAIAPMESSTRTRRSRLAPRPIPVLRVRPATTATTGPRTTTEASGRWRPCSFAATDRSTTSGAASCSSCPARGQPGPAPRRLHVAAVGGVRPHARWPRRAPSRAQIRLTRAPLRLLRDLRAEGTPPVREGLRGARRGGPQAGGGQDLRVAPGRIRYGRGAGKSTV